MLLVVGAGGYVGSTIVKQLAGESRRVRALVRSPEHPLPAMPNLEIALGDIADPTILDSTLAGIDTAFLASPFDSSLPEVQIRFIEAAKAAGVRRIVQLSGMGANTSACCVRALSWYGQVEEALLASGLEHVRLRPAFVLQSLLRVAQEIVRDGLIYGPYRNAPWAWVDARDVGAVAAAVLSSEVYNGQVFTVTGSEAIPFPDLAARMSAALDVPVRYVDVTANEMRGRLQAMGASQIVIAAMLEMCDAYVSGFLRIEPTSVVQDLTGRPPRSLEQFLADYREHFRLAA
jgi:uncharacterized protein YbjT (DUF2867 family)